MLTILLIVLIISLFGGGFALRATGGILSIMLHVLAFLVGIGLLVRLLA